MREHQNPADAGAALRVELRRLGSWCPPSVSLPVARLLDELGFVTHLCWDISPQGEGLRVGCYRERCRHPIRPALAFPSADDDAVALVAVALERRRSTQAHDQR